MMMTVELSMYPFQDNYRDLIKDFTRRLNEQADLSVTTGPTSTVIVGDYARVMTCVTEMIQWSYDEHGRAVFVAKILPGYEPD